MRDALVNTRSLVVSDIFFGLAAILLILLALMSASLQTMLQSTAPEHADSLEAAQELLAEFPVILFLDNAGITTIGENASHVPLNAILSNERLPSLLAQDPLILIASDGIEAAFLMSALAERLDILALNTARLDKHCSDLSLVQDTTLRCRQ